MGLKLCQQHLISKAPLYIYARLNTLVALLRTHETNSETLVTYRKRTVRKYLVSCDTKEERIQWRGHLNNESQRAKT